MRILLLSAALLALGLAGAHAQTYGFWTIAGLAPNQGDADGTGTNISFTRPAGVSLDLGGSVYVADTANNTLRQLTLTGGNWASSTIAGLARVTGHTDGTGSAARFNRPYGLAVDINTNIFVADSDNNTIRQLTLSGGNWTSATIAGTALISGSQDGSGAAIQFKTPYGIAVDTNDNVYVADTGNHTIRLLTYSGGTWSSTTIAGSAGTPGSTDGTGSGALFKSPYGIAVDKQGNLYVADTGNNTIRMLTQSGGSWTSSTLAGTPGVTGTNDGSNAAIKFNTPAGIAVDSSGNLYIGDYANDTIRKLIHSGANWVSSTIGGIGGISGSTDGVGSAARFDNPWGVALDTAANVYVADLANSTIRSTIAPPAGPPVFVSTTLNNNVLTLTWSSISGRTYQVYYSTNVSPTHWSNLNSSAMASGVTMSTTDPLGASSRRFYRVALLP